MWRVMCTGSNWPIKRIINGSGVVALSLMLGACSGGFSRFEGSGFGRVQNSSGNDKIVTSSLAPIPGEPAYNGEQPRYRSAPAYANANPRSLAPPPRQTAEATAGGQTITVRQGETLYSISERYGVPVDRIKTANNLSSANLAVGRTLIIPGGRSSATPVAQNSSYKVQPGESLAAIARRHGVTHQELARHNNMSNPGSLQPGQTIQLPAGVKPVALASTGGSSARRMPLPAAKPTRGATQVASGTNRRPDIKPIRVASNSAALELPGKPKASTPKPQRIAHLGKLPKPQPMSASQFRWPVRGRVISGYGSKPNGKHNDGINISVPQGTSVKAAENGVVAYAGSELKGYGKLILIRHSDDWVSAYAHNEELLVQRGEKIRRGQIIAKAGQSGTVNKPQVHFELRKGSRPMNPMKHLAGI